MFHQVYEAFCAVGSGQRQIVNVAPDMSGEFILTKGDVVEW